MIRFVSLSPNIDLEVNLNKTKVLCSAQVSSVLKKIKSSTLKPFRSSWIKNHCTPPFGRLKSRSNWRIKVLFAGKKPTPASNQLIASELISEKVFLGFTQGPPYIQTKGNCGSYTDMAVWWKIGDMCIGRKRSNWNRKRKYQSMI